MALEMLEPCAGKLARTVLRGLGAGNSPRLPDFLIKVCKLNSVIDDSVQFFKSNFIAISLLTLQVEFPFMCDTANYDNFSRRNWVTLFRFVDVDQPMFFHPFSGRDTPSSGTNFILAGL